MRVVDAVVMVLDRDLGERLPRRVVPIEIRARRQPREGGERDAVFVLVRVGERGDHVRRLAGRPVGHLLAADEQCHLARARGDGLPRRVDARAARRRGLIDALCVGSERADVVCEGVRDARLTLELAARHVRDVEVIERLRANPGVVETVERGLREQVTDPPLSLPELRHRRADNRYVGHTRLSCGAVLTFRVRYSPTRTSATATSRQPTSPAKATL